MWPTYRKFFFDHFVCGAVPTFSLSGNVVVCSYCCCFWWSVPSVCDSIFLIEVFIFKKIFSCCMSCLSNTGDVKNLRSTYRKTRQNRALSYHRAKKIFLLFSFLQWTTSSIRTRTTSWRITTIPHPTQVLTIPSVKKLSPPWEPLRCSSFTPYSSPGGERN